MPHSYPTVTKAVSNITQHSRQSSAAIAHWNQILMHSCNAHVRYITQIDFCGHFTQHYLSVAAENFSCVTSLCHSKQAAARCIVLSGWLWLKLDIRDILLTLWILEYSFHQLFLKLNVPFILHHLLFCVQIMLNSRRAAMITSNTFPHQLLDCKYKFC